MLCSSNKVELSNYNQISAFKMSTIPLEWNLPEHSWSRRCSTETIFSIQGKETDIARDTSDSEAVDSETFEYEPVTESEEDGPVDADSTDFSDSDLIKTKVVEVSLHEGDQVFADSEHTDLAPASGSDSEIDFHNFWNCAQCRVANNNPLYSYCQKCHKNRQNFFPRRPQPRRKHKRETGLDSGALSQPSSQHSSVASQPLSLSQDSGVYSLASQDDPPAAADSKNRITTKKRRSESADRVSKRPKYSHSSSESESDNEVSPLAKTISDPAITIHDTGVTKKVIANSVKEIERVDAKELCVICITEPKSGVFVHGRIAHICCCYPCAKKVWAKAKRCPVCNCKISNVLRAVVM